MIITVYSLIEESQVNGTFINYLVPVFVPERQKDTDTAIIIPTHVDDRMNDHGFQREQTLERILSFT